MQSRVFVLCLLAAPLALAPSALVGHAAAPAAVHESLSAVVLEASHGDFDGKVEQFLYNPNGTRTTTTLTVGALLSIISNLSMDEAKTQTAAPNRAIAFGDADSAVRFATDWPFCDGASEWVSYLGRAGQSFALLKPEPVSLRAANTERNFCGNNFGPVATWQDVTLDSRGLTAPGHCGDGQVVVPLGAPVTYPRGITGLTVGLGGILCGNTVTSAHGNGAVGSWQIFDFAIDFFLGSQAVMLLGTDYLPGS